MARGAYNSDNPIWVAYPSATILVAVLLSVVPFGLSSTVLAPPSFGLVTIYLWAIYRPEFIPAPLVFSLGILQDFLWSGPVGLWAFVYLVIYGLTVSQRLVLIGQGFGFMWAGFGLIALVAGLLSWISASFYYGMAVPLAPVFVQVILSTAVYPLFIKIVPVMFIQAAQSGVTD